MSDFGFDAQIRPPAPMDRVESSQNTGKEKRKKDRADEEETSQEQGEHKATVVKDKVSLSHQHSKSKQESHKKETTKDHGKGAIIDIRV